MIISPRHRRAVLGAHGVNIAPVGLQKLGKYGSIGLTGPNVRAQLSPFVAGGGGPVGVDRLFACNEPHTDTLYEVSMLDVAKTKINEAAFVDLNPTGIGGIIGALFCVSNTADKIYNIDPDTLIPVSSLALPAAATFPIGCGGTATQLFVTDTVTDEIYEIDPVTLIEIGASTSTPGSNPRGCGGTATQLFVLNTGFSNLAEIDPATKLIIGVGVTNAGEDGCGGVSTRLWTSSSGNVKAYETDPATKLVIATTSGFTAHSWTGIGGTKES